MLTLAAFLRAAPVPAQHLEASPSKAATEFYAPSVTPAIYLINFLFLYIANPDVAANLPAYKAPIPQPVVDCLNQNPTGCMLRSGHASRRRLAAAVSAGLKMG